MTVFVVFLSYNISSYTNQMEAKSKYFFPILFLLIAGSVGATYYRFIFAKNYAIEGTSECDPMSEACFVHECDPAAEECSDTPEENTSYYRKVSRMAKNIPQCDPNTEGCDALLCPEGEADCEETLCDEVSVAESGDTCNDPVEYQIAHPLDESDESTEESGAESIESTDVESSEPIDPIAPLESSELPVQSEPAGEEVVSPPVIQ